MGEKFFRPSLVIFVGKMGKVIFSSYRSIISSSGLAEELQNCVGLIQIPEEDDSTRNKQGSLQATESFVSISNDNALEAKPFPDVLDVVRSRLQQNNNLQQVRNVGYTIPDKPLQIFIVGDPALTELGIVLRVIRSKLSKAEVYYVLYHPYKTTLGQQAPLPPLFSKKLDWNKRIIADFCYLYENWYLDTEISEEQSCYASAQALYALITTGITLQEDFKQAIKRRPKQSGDQRIGTLSTCMISYPYEAAWQYCNFYYGVGLLDNWLSSDEAKKAEEEKKLKSQLSQLQLQAKNDVSTIEQWVVDRETCSGTNTQAEQSPSLRRFILRLKNATSLHSQIKERKGPSLAILQPEVLHKYMQHSNALFHLFSLAIVDDAYKQTNSSSDWTDFLSDLTTKKYEAWKIVAGNAWKMADEKMIDALKDSIKDIWGKSVNSTESNNNNTITGNTNDDNTASDGNTISGNLLKLSFTYLEGAEQQLKTLKNHINEWQHHHSDAEYTKTMSNLAKELDITSSPASQDKDTKIVTIKDILVQRVKTEQEGKPKVLTMSVMSIFTIVILAFMLSTLFPASRLLFITFLCFGIAYVWIVNISFTMWHQRKINTARSNLLKFYYNSYVHQCEEFEDQQRCQLVEKLEQEIVSLREHHKRIINLTAEVKSYLQTKSDDVVKNFLTKLPYLHDIPVIEGKRIQKQRAGESEYAGTFQNVINTVNVNAEHDKKTVQMELQNRLYGWIENCPQVPSENEVRELILNIAKRMTKEHLQQPLDIRPLTLSDGEIWKHICHTSLKPFSHSPMETKEPLLVFMCGKEEKLRSGQKTIQDFFQATKADLVEIADNTDVLVAAFFRGGSSLASHFDTLFPLKDPQVEEPLIQG